jgi:hypothetical protein
MVSAKVDAFTMTDLNHRSQLPARRLAPLLGAGLALLLGTCGCFRGNPNAGGLGRQAEVTFTRLSTVMTGPTANLLTNVGGFQADCVITLSAPEAKRPQKLAGEIFVRGQKLRLETAPGKSKAANPGQFGIIWDAGSRRGFAFSEALQGYAPLGATVQFTNVAMASVPGQPDQFEGHLVEHGELTVIGADGQKRVLQVTRAKDLDNVPLLIESASEPNAFALTLTKVQPGVPGDDLFQPPDGFTKYESQPALLNELAARMQDVFGEAQENGAVRGENSEPGNYPPTRRPGE